MDMTLLGKVIVFTVIGIAIGVTLAAVYGPDRAQQAYDAAIREVLQFPLFAWRKVKAWLKR